jgi:cell shape-determining protein MreD
MWLRVVVISLIMSLVACLQVAFLGSLSNWPNLNLVLVVLVLAVFVSSRRSALFAALVLGLILEAWSFVWFGSWLFILLALTVLSFVAVENIFTNKSLYSYLLLIVVCGLIYEGYWLVVLSWPAPVNWQWSWLALVVQKSLLNMAAGTVLFYLAIALSSSFQSVILVKKKY